MADNRAELGQASSDVTFLSLQKSLFDQWAAWNPGSMSPYPHCNAKLEIPAQSHFFNKHISPKLVCRRVHYSPDLHSRIAHLVDDELRKHKFGTESSAVASVLEFPYMDPHYRRQTIRRAGYVFIEAGYSVPMRYASIIAELCVTPASTLHFHPGIWRETLSWRPLTTDDHDSVQTGELKFTHHVSSSSEELRKFPHDDFLDSDTRNALRKVEKAQPILATWIMFGISEKEIGVMNSILTTYAGEGDTATFHWKHCDAVPGTGSQASKRDFKVEANSRIVTDILEAVHVRTNPHLHGSDLIDASLGRSGSSLDIVEEMQRVALTVRPWMPPDLGWSPSPQVMPDREVGDNSLNAQSVMQHLWAECVPHDTTMSVIHGANYEIICVRDRQEQTLYFSDLLHIPSMKQPGYSITETGVYILAAEDAALRIQSRKSDGDATNMSNLPPKLPTPSIVSGRSYSQRFKKLVNEAADYNTLLMSLRYGIYDSPAPAEFRRFEAQETSTASRNPFRHVETHPLDAITCIHLTLQEQIGSGRMGIVHAGRINLGSNDTEDGIDVVVKMCFMEELKQEMIAESRAYERLRQHKVSGVPTLLGIFEDVNPVGPTIIILPRAGTNLVDCQQGMVTRKQKDHLLRTIRAIHEAGVLHGDLRGDNVLIDSGGHATVIDFNMSKLDPSQTLIDKERREMIGVCAFILDSKPTRESERLKTKRQVAPRNIAAPPPPPPPAIGPERTRKHRSRRKAAADPVLKIRRVPASGMKLRSLPVR